MKSSTPPLPLEIPHLLRLRQVQTFLPVSKTQIYNLISKGVFPAPVKMGKTSFWRSGDVLEYVRKVGGEV